MDNGSNFCSVLTTKFLKRLGVFPCFVALYHAEANGLIERFYFSFKTMLHFAMREFGRSWHKAIPLLIWVLRESPNATTGVSPFMLQCGICPVVREVCAPYRRVRIPGSSDLCVCEVSANEDIALRTCCFHFMIQQAIR